MNILSLSGYVPEQICDTIRFTRYQGSKRISHYCGYLTDYISQVLEDPSVDGAVFPRSCDSSRSVAAYLAECGKFSYQIPVPSSTMTSSVEYLAHSIKRYKEAVELHYSVRLNDIDERANYINIRNAQLSQLYQSVCSDGGYSAYLSAIHQMLQMPLYQQKVENIKSDSLKTGKPVYLVGSFLCDLNIVKEIEKVGLMVAGDNLTESKRLFSASPVRSEADIYHEIADSILKNRLSPTQNNFAQIIQCDLEEIRAKSIKGVIFITQKFCEPYDYLFSVYQKALSEWNIPVLQLVGNSTSDYPRTTLMIEAFADRL